MLSRKIFVSASGIDSGLRFTKKTLLRSRKYFQSVGNILNEQILYKISILQLFDFYIYILTPYNWNID